MIVKKQRDKHTLPRSNNWWYLSSLSGMSFKKASKNRGFFPFWRTFCHNI